MTVELKKVMSVILLTIALDANAKPLDVSSLSEELQENFYTRITKRSPDPLEIGFVSFESPITKHGHQASGYDHPQLTHEHLVTFDQVHVSDALLSGSIKTEAIYRGPFVDHGTVLNVVEHDLPQTHDHFSNERQSDQVLIDYNQPDIVFHNIDTIQGLNHGSPKDRKTSYTSKLSHLISNDDINIPFVTETTSSDVHVIPIAHNMLIPSQTTKAAGVDSHISHSEENRRTTEHRSGTLGRRTTYGRRQSYNYRDYVGGYGVGLKSGGQGAGHGFYING